MLIDVCGGVRGRGWSGREGVSGARPAHSCGSGWWLVGEVETLTAPEKIIGLERWAEMVSKCAYQIGSRASFLCFVTKN